MSSNRDTILATATRLFAERGLARTTTVMLAKEAGLSEGTLFRYFKNKENIFLELIRSLCERITADVYKYLEVSRPQTGIEQICAVMRACFVFAGSNSNEFSLIFRDAPGRYCDPKGTPYEQFRYIVDLLKEHFRKGIETGKTDGSIKQDIDTSEMSSLLAGALIGVMRSINLGFIENTEKMLPTMLQSVQTLLEPKTRRRKG